MQELKRQEIFEIEVLEKLKNAGLLEPLVFGGGTMLRLCHDLNRYSADLDFWFIKKIDVSKYFSKLKEVLGATYTLTDAKIKFFTVLLELKSENYPRKLKIEIRKRLRIFHYEEKIAFSKYSNKQVLLKCLTLEQMMQNKINAFLERGEIRDCFDIEFLLKRGIKLETSTENLKKIKEKIKKLKDRDYKVTLGSLLEPAMRQYYTKHNFDYLVSTIDSLL